MNISITFVAQKLNLKENQVETVLKLMEEGATVPFIARYRKGVTGGLDEEVIQQIAEMYEYNVELNKRKEAIIQILKEKGLLTPEIEAKLKEASTKSEVENIYEPFKVGKKTKASDAIALGLEPLAKAIMEATDEKFNPFKEAEKYLNEKVPTVDFAIEQAKFIISQIMSQDPSTREYVKKQIYDFGYIETKLKNAEIDEKQVFKQYYEYKERIKFIPNHRVLAVTRGEDLKILSYSMSYNEQKIMYDLNNKYFKIKRTGKIIYDSLKDALDRLIYPSIEREIKADLFERAEKEAIHLFAENLESMLLWPAVKNRTVMAIDPAFINGCKIAILDPNGKFLAKSIIFPNTHKDNEPSKKVVNDLLDRYHSINTIVIGNGTASRETENFISNLIKERRAQEPSRNIQYAIVSEIGASVYSASKVAIEEFPNLSVEERSAINIGRRYQDPLNELIKIDPKAIGVGQYQHDVNQKELSKALEFKVDKVVNMVGVDLNSATKEILGYISGLSSTLAKNIIDYREKHKSFKTREELKEVKGLGDKAYEQCVGFLRIHDSKNFYDRTSIHPESYFLAQQVVDKLNLDLADVDAKIVKEQDTKKLANEFKSNEYDIQLILDSLVNPMKDIREDKAGYMLKDDVLNIEDIKEGMIFDGTILNITDFGIFVYIGIPKSSVLVHITHMKKTKDEYIKHPSEIVKTGDNVKVEIIEIEKDRNRIQGRLIRD